MHKKKFSEKCTYVGHTHQGLQVSHIFSPCSTWNIKTLDTVKITITLDTDIIHQLEKTNMDVDHLCSALIKELAQTLTTDELVQASKNIGVLLKKINQIDIMLGLLQTHGQITTKQAKRHGVDNPGFWIHQLKMQGHVITSRWANESVPVSKNYKIYTYQCTQSPSSCLPS